MFDISELPRPLIRYGVGIWRRRWIIVAIAWLTAFAGWLAIAFLPDKYESRAHVFVQEAIVDPLLKDVAARPNYEQRIDALRVSLLTFPNVEEMVYRAKLDATIDATNSLDRQAQLENIVKNVASGIRIGIPQDNYLILRYAHEDPTIARNVVDAAVNILIEQDLGASLRQSQISEEKLRVTIADYDELLAEQETEIAQYRRIHAGELADSLSTEQSRERRNEQLEEIIDSKSQVSLRIETLRARLAVTPRVTTGGELGQLQVELSQLRSQYNDNYPDIQNILSRIERLESDDALPDNPEYKRIQAELAGARDTLRALTVRQDRIRAEIESEAVIVGQAPAVVAELQRLQRSLSETQTTHRALIASRDALALRRTLDNTGQGGLDYQVIERPRKALVPNDPPRLILIVGVFFLAFGAGGGLALLLAFLDRTYTQIGDLE